MMVHPYPYNLENGTFFSLLLRLFVNILRRFQIVMFLLQQKFVTMICAVIIQRNRPEELVQKKLKRHLIEA